MMEFDIHRKKTFNGTAALYDACRPSYPRALIDDACSLAGITDGARLLEIGAGTGKATTLFAEYGCLIDAVEPGKDLAQILISNCAQWPRINVHTKEFESFSCSPNAYDLVYSAQAFHWIDPSVRMEMTARALKPDGALALLYNFSPKPDDQVISDIAVEIARRTGNEVNSLWDYSKDINRWKNEINTCGFFNTCEIREYKWKMEFTAEQYAGLYLTFSDFLSLEKKQQETLYEYILDTVNANGGNVVKPYLSVLFYAQKKKGAETPEGGANI